MLNSKMHTEDGPSLPVDQQLCLALYVSAFCALSFLRCLCHVLPGIFSLLACCRHLAEPKFTQCKTTRRYQIPSVTD